MMNYFELYELPVSFHPDKDVVKKKFYELSKKYHPDRYTLADEEAQTEALQMAALNNAAYKILMNEDATMQYVLKLKGITEDEEKYNLPADFLMEMMELNEAVSDYEMEPDEEKKQLAVGSWQEQIEQLNREMEMVTKKYDETGNKDLLKQIKDLYYRKKYLLRIQERINTFATH